MSGYTALLVEGFEWYANEHRSQKCFHGSETTSPSPPPPPPPPHVSTKPDGSAEGGNIELLNNILSW